MNGNVYDILSLSLGVTSQLGIHVRLLISKVRLCLSWYPLCSHSVYFNLLWDLLPFLETHLQQLLFELLHLRQVELTEQVGHGVQAVAFLVRSVVPVHFSQSVVCVNVAVAAVAVLIVAVGSRDGAAVGPVGVLGELEALNASDSERQMGPCAVDTVAQADVVGQFLSQIVLLLALTLEGIQGLLQLTLRNVLQT